MKDITKFTVDPVRYAPHELRMRVLERDNYECQYCFKVVTRYTANIDHVMPWLHGGFTKLKNLVTSCWECNKAKGNRLWDIPQVVQKKKRQRRANRKLKAT